MKNTNTNNLKWISNWNLNNLKRNISKKCTFCGFHFFKKAQEDSLCEDCREESDMKALLRWSNEGGAKKPVMIEKTL
jgi:predicted Zn-ribbon and HTH transcriptional regulator